MLSLSHLLRNLYLLSFLSAEVTAQYSAFPRWGQSSAIVNNILFVYGGKTDQYNQYSYTSAPNNNDLLQLSLSTPFDLAAPPWQYLAGSSNLSTTQGPAIAWSTLSAYNTSQLLLFGGEPGPNSATVISTLPDSAAILDISDRITPQWTSKPNLWANEPTRRIYHSASSTGGKIWVIGGEKADGSNNAISDHEVFDPSAPAFVQLPTANGPPDIYGHTSIVLSNGSLIVFGGYSQSLASMIPLSTIWMLDTTANDLRWTTLSVASASLPNPRRGFAAALLGNGKVLVHGGTDATLGTTYSDGWMLDTAQDPVVWSAVPQLSQLGPRRDHLAVANGNAVFFAFGYGSNGPASTGPLLYDCSSGTWPTAFTPSAATPVNTLPPSSETNTLTNTLTSSMGSAYLSGGSSTGTVHPTSTGGSSGIGNTGDRARTIALITVFAVLGLIVGLFLAIYFIRRRRRRNTTHFHILGISEDDESPHAGEPIPVAGIVAPRPTFFGFGGRTNSPMRRDMLADEDTRHFGVLRREGSDATLFNAFVRGEKPGFTVHGSLASLRSIGAMLGISAAARGDKTRESSKSSRASSWAEKGLDPFSDEAALVPGHSNASRLKGGRTSDWALPTYVDPFSDKDIGEFHGGDADAHSISMEAMLDGQRYFEIPVPTPEHGSLSPIMEMTNHRSGPHSSESVDHPPPSGNSTIGSSSHSSDEILQSPGVRRSSILNANPPPNQPIRRSDSWWSKFTKTPFLDRRSSDGARSQHLVEFRDPNPAPRLGAIEERSPDSQPPSRNSSVNRYRHQMYSIVTHGRSVSSMQTADSEALERVCGMDIVQRDSTIGSRQSSGIDDPVAPISGPPPSAVMSADSSGESREERSNLSGVSGVSLSPMSASDPARPSTHPSSSRTTIPESGARSSYPTTGGLVSSRIQAFERRLSLDAESSRLPSLDERSTKNREFRMGKDRDRRTVKYGFAPKPSLFVANPDRRKSCSSTS